MSALTDIDVARRRSSSSTALVAEPGVTLSAAIVGVMIVGYFG